jgi:DNA repair protein RadB
VENPQLIASVKHVSLKKIFNKKKWYVGFIHFQSFLFSCLLTENRSMKRLSLNNASLDDLLGGGIEYKAITNIFGEAGTGKTNFCLQAARECAENGSKVAFIDSEGVSLERLEQICPQKNFKKILKNILFFNPTSMDEQEKMINNALKIPDVSLVIVDTMNLFYRLGLENDKEGTTRSFTRQIAQLQITAREKNLSVLISEQVYTDKNGEIRPFTSRDSEHMVKAILKLEKTGIGTRKATIMKHRSQPEGKTVAFTITATGLD